MVKLTFKQSVLTNKLNKEPSKYSELESKEGTWIKWSNGLFGEYVNFLLVIILENIGFLFQAIILMNQLGFQEMIKWVQFAFRFSKMRSFLLFLVQLRSSPMSKID